MSDVMLPCAVVSSDTALCRRVRDLAAQSERGLDLVQEVRTPLPDLDREAVDALRTSNLKVLVVEVGGDPRLGLRFARFVAEGDPTRAFVLIGPPAEAEVLLEAMRIGASEYLPSPVHDEDLAAALSRAAKRVGGATTIREHQESGSIIAVFSAKGGAGVSTTAANLAVQLHEATHRKTILVDLDLELGSSELLLGLHARYSVLDVARNLHRMDADLLESLIERHESGLHLLASPAQPTGPEALTREQVRSIIGFLRRTYEFVVLDLARTVTPVTTAAFETADHVLVMVTPEIQALRNTKKVLPFVERSVGHGDRIHIVLNRSDAADLIKSSDVARALEHKVYRSLAADEETVGSGADEGRPVVLNGKSRFARDLRALATDLAGPYAVNGKPHGGLFARVLRRGKATERRKS